MKNQRMIICYSLLIAFLNILDGIATNYRLIHHFIEELNPLMNTLWQISPIIFLGTKIMLSISIVYISHLVYQKSHATFQRRYFYSLIGLFMLYVGICCTHIVWLNFI